MLDSKGRRVGRRALVRDQTVAGAGLDPASVWSNRLVARNEFGSRELGRIVQVHPRGVGELLLEHRSNSSRDCTNIENALLKFVLSMHAPSWPPAGVWAIHHTLT